MHIEIPESNITIINGIKTYSIDTLCCKKVSAYLGRDRIRDLYDMVSICNKYYDQLSLQTIGFLRNALEYKGVTYFDYVTKTQSDKLIDAGKLADSFLDAYDKLGLLLEKEELEVIERNGKTSVYDVADDVDSEVDHDDCNV